jgi:hypothetical protein
MKRGAALAHQAHGSAERERCEGKQVVTRNPKTLKAPHVFPLQCANMFKTPGMMNLRCMLGRHASSYIGPL